MGTLIQELEKLETAFRENNLLSLKRIGNEAIEKAALHSDKLLAEVSLIAYSLNKLGSKEHVVRNKKWLEIKKAIIESIGRAIESLKEKNTAQFEKSIDEISKDVSGIDNNLGHYVMNIYSKARLKQASRAYACGLSLSAAADLTGTDKKQLMLYIGGTKIHEEKISKLGIKQRVAKIRELFK